MMLCTLVRVRMGLPNWVAAAINATNEPAEKPARIAGSNANQNSAAKASANSTCAIGVDTAWTKANFRLCTRLNWLAARNRSLCCSVAENMRISSNACMLSLLSWVTSPMESCMRRL